MLLPIAIRVFLLALFVLGAITAALMYTSMGLWLLNATSGCQRCRVHRAIAYGPHPRQRLDLYVPDAVAGAEAAPVVLFFYGGRWRTGKREEYRFVATALAACGIMTAVADYRLYPEVNWQDFNQDGALAYCWLERHIRAHHGDPDRIFVMGHSAGAYIAAMVALDPALRLRAGALTRPAGLIGIAGPYDFFPFTDPDVCEVFQSTPDGHGTQPIHYVAATPPPALLLTGARDRTVNPLNSVHLQRQLKIHGGEAELVRFPGLGHVGIILSVARMFRFLAPSTATIRHFIERNS